jgi:hypothetical protein
MSKTISLSLGGSNFAVPMMNLGQQARAMAIDEATPDALLQILKIGLEGATPEVSLLDEIRATPREIRDAVEKLAAFSGFKIAERPIPTPHALR